jgi:hypothetical protein
MLGLWDETDETLALKRQFKLVLDITPGIACFCIQFGNNG